MSFFMRKGQPLRVLYLHVKYAVANKIFNPIQPPLPLGAGQGGGRVDAAAAKSEKCEKILLLP